MGQINTIFKSETSEFERLESSPQETRKAMPDPRSPSADITRTPIETKSGCENPSVTSAHTRLLPRFIKKASHERLLHNAGDFTPQTTKSKSS